MSARDGWAIAFGILWAAIFVLTATGDNRRPADTMRWGLLIAWGCLMSAGFVATVVLP